MGGGNGEKSGGDECVKGANDERKREEKDEWMTRR